jgi:hypothetical protein
MSNNLFSVSVYQINQSAPIPLAQVTTIGFPGGQILGRSINDANNNPGYLLSTGIRVYGAIQTANGSQYYVMQTLAQILTLANT